MKISSLFKILLKEEFQFMGAVGRVLFRYPDEQIRSMIEAKRVELVREEITRLFQFSISISMSRKTHPNAVSGLKSNWAQQECLFTESYSPIPDPSNEEPLQTSNDDQIPTFKNEITLSNTIAETLQALYVKKFALIKSELLNPDSIITLTVTLLYVDKVWEELTPIDLTLPITRHMFAQSNL